jgi:hypothetical protein
MTSIHAHRDSDISVSKFNRWVVAERSRSIGDDGRTELETLRTQRKSAQESHRQYGASLAAASRAQIQRDRQECDALRQSNLMKGLSVRDDVVSMKEEKERLKSEWVEYGRKLAEKDVEQRRKIRDVCGEGSRRVQDMVAQAKFEEEEYERELAERRAELLQQNREEVARVKEETADTVTDAAKQFALDRRRQVAKSTKQATSQWKKEQAKNTADHLKTARQNRAEAEATRAHTKKLREQIVQQRQKEANATREAARKNKLIKDQQLLESGQGIKAVHDSIYRSKYVPQESAEMLAQSPTAKFGGSSQAKEQISEGGAGSPPEAVPIA